MGDFNKVLKKLRVSEKITQEELAKALNISRSTVGMYEKGDREPDYETLEAIADYFNVSIDYLLGRESKTLRFVDPIETIAAHFDGDNFTEEEIDEIRSYAKYVKSKRKNWIWYYSLEMRNLTKFEDLEQFSSENNLDIDYINFKNNRIKGLYIDGSIALSTSLNTDAERSCVLAEELGHHFTSTGDILDTTNQNAAKQELRARRYAHDLLIDYDLLYQAKLTGCSNIAEVAECLGITEEFLKEALENLESRYGSNYHVGQYHISFNPFDIELIN